MNPVDKYIVKGIVCWCLVAQTAISMLFIATQSVRLMPLFSGLSVDGSMGRLALYALVPVWGWSLLPSFLLAVCLQAGTMASRGEMTAIFGAGISVRRIARWPVFVSIIFFGISASLWLSGVPLAESGFHRTAHHLWAKGVTDTFVPGRFNQPIENLVFYSDVKHDANSFSGIYLALTIPDKTQILVAKRMKIRLMEAQEALEMRFYGGELFDFSGDAGEAHSKMTVLSFEKLKLRISISDAINEKMSSFNSPDEIPTHQLLRRKLAGSVSSEDEYALLIRFVRPCVFLLTALLSVGLAFSVRWKHPFEAITAGIGLFSLVHLAERMGVVWMIAQDLSAPIAATLPLGVPIITVLLWGLSAWSKNQFNPL